MYTTYESGYPLKDFRFGATLTITFDCNGLVEVTVLGVIRERGDSGGGDPGDIKTPVDDAHVDYRNRRGA